MSKEHVECAKRCFCDLCGTYLGTMHLLALHNEKEHNINEHPADYSETESEITKHECKHCPAEFKYLSELERHIEENHNGKVKMKKQKNKKK